MIVYLLLFSRFQFAEDDLRGFDDSLGANAEVNSQTVWVTGVFSSYSKNSLRFGWIMMITSLTMRMKNDDETADCYNTEIITLPIVSLRTIGIL